MIRNFNQNRSGQTLIALLIFIMVALTITVSATAVAIINMKSNNGMSDGQTAYRNAESGVENALFRLQRNANYTGETMTLPTGTATITVSGTGTKTIVSIGKNGDNSRKITVTARNTSNVITLLTWKETP